MTKQLFGWVNLSVINIALFLSVFSTKANIIWAFRDNASAICLLLWDNYRSIGIKTLSNPIFCDFLVNGISAF